MPFAFSDSPTLGGRWEIQLLEEREETNELGVFEVLKLRTENVNFIFPDAELLERDLKLIYGIGPATIGKLNEAGYYTISDLLQHPKWRQAASEVLRIIKSKDYYRLARYGASDLQLLGFFKPEEIIFIDIETSGLYYIHPVFLVGMLTFKDGQGMISQILARNPAEERALLFETIGYLKKANIIVSFNGRSFDLPYLKGRMRFQGLSDEISTFHFDLLRQARRNYRSQLPNCRLLTIERYLFNQERIDDLPGVQIAEYYHRYLETEDRGYLKPILEHNACDLLTMAKLLGLITE
ncbi:MAG: ribonuclease H-like domain-containing protein [Bacteroidota bacterium]